MSQQLKMCPLLDCLPTEHASYSLAHSQVIAKLFNDNVINPSLDSVLVIC